MSFSRDMDLEHPVITNLRQTGQRKLSRSDADPAPVA